jgi:hypothetical protein
LKLLWGEWDYEESGTFDYTHLRWYTRRTLVALLQGHGFVIKHFVADGWIPLPGLRLVIGKQSRAQVNRLACRVFPGLFGYQLLFHFRKP